MQPVSPSPPYILTCYALRGDADADADADARANARARPPAAALSSAVSNVIFATACLLHSHAGFREVFAAVSPAAVKDAVATNGLIGLFVGRGAALPGPSRINRAGMVIPPSDVDVQLHETGELGHALQGIWLNTMPLPDALEALQIRATPHYVPAYMISTTFTVTYR